MFAGLGRSSASFTFRQHHTSPVGTSSDSTSNCKVYEDGEKDCQGHEGPLW